MAEWSGWIGPGPEWHRFDAPRSHSFILIKNAICRVCVCVCVFLLKLKEMPMFNVQKTQLFYPMFNVPKPDFHQCSMFKCTVSWVKRQDAWFIHGTMCTCTAQLQLTIDALGQGGNN